MTGWEAALLAATALHAGFQLTISVLVYPALARVPEASWAVEHDRHSRRIVPLVGVVYAALVVAGLGAVITASSPATWVAVLGSAVAVATTALVAAPLHGRLAGDRDPARLRRLLRADLVRTGAAVAALAAALTALL